MYQMQMPMQNPYMQGIAMANQLYNDAVLTPAKRNLYMAQAQAARQPKATPYNNAMQLYHAYEIAPEGSDMKKMLAAMINKEVSTNNGMNITMPNGQTIQIGGSGGSALFGGGNTASTANINPTSASKYSMRGAQVATKNPDGTVTIHQSPDSSTTGQLQQRQLGEAESKTLTKPVVTGVSEYSGFGSTPSLLWHIMMAKRGDKDAQQNVANYLLARQLLPELATIRAKQAGFYRPGTEVQHHYEDVVWPSRPDDWAMGFAPSNMQANAVTQAQQGMNSAINAAGQESARNFPVTMNNPPYWAGNSSTTTANASSPAKTSPTSSSTKTVTQAYINNFAKTHGVPVSVLKKELAKRGYTING